MRNFIVIITLILSIPSLFLFSQNNQEIPFEKDKSGIIFVKVSINGFSEKFIFDTGASGISLNSKFYQTLINNSLISSKDIIGYSMVMLADGSQKQGTIVNLKNVLIGSYTFENINAVVMPDPNAPLLLGQSIFQKFEKVSIDYLNKLITLEGAASANSTYIKNNQTKSIKFIACSYNDLGKVSLLKNIIIKKDNSILLSEEKNIPPPINAVNKLSIGYTIRYFSNDDYTNTVLIKEMIEQDIEGVVTIENMLPFFNYKESPGYFEIWIK